MALFPFLFVSSKALNKSKSVFNLFYSVYFCFIKTNFMISQSSKGLQEDKHILSSL